MQSYAVLLSDTTTVFLKRLSDVNGISFRSVLLGAFQVFLHRFEQRPRVPVITAGENGHGREWTVSQSDFAADETFTEFLFKLDRSLRLASPMPLADQTLSDIDGMANHTSHFRAAFEFRDDMAPALFSLQTLQTLGCPLALQIVLDLNGVCSEWYFDPVLYRVDEMERMALRFEIFCQNLTTRPDAPYSRISLLSQSEAEKILITWNSTEAAVPWNGELLAMFESWVDRIPQTVAVVSENGRLTYSELELRANKIAHALRHSGVQKGDVVAIFLERGPDLICAQLGVLKSGAAFAALDPRVPREALTRIIATVECPFILTRQALASALPPIPARLFCFDDPAWSASQPVTRLVSLVCPDDPACVLFTSGSTGQPKAVLYLHRNLAARFSNSVQIGGVDQATVFAQSSPVTSIDAIDEIFLPLVSGGCTIILSYETVTNLRQLVASLSAHQVTHILLVPSLLRVILSAEESLDKKLNALKTWMIGGELLTGALTREFHKQLPEARLINYYGLTEGDATCHVTSSTFEYPTSVPIGRPVGNTKIYLLDEYLNSVPEGQAGEIYLAGEGLFHEYINRPELNAERWVPNPFVRAGAYARLFRTGDLGRFRLDGEIEYLGRRDRMVKVRGFRVELGEVEALLSQHPAVDQCVVVAKQPAGGSENRLVHQSQIVAYAILKHGEIARSPDLRAFLKDHLPDYALPSVVLTLDSFPLSSYGKVDIKALPDPDSREMTLCKDYIAPRDATEMQLVHIWEKLLKVNHIGVTANFFEIGGDSLSAIDLMLILEKQFQCNLPITVLFQSPTIVGLANVLREDGKSVSWSSLVPIRAQGVRPPLYCIHADGSVFIYRRFANYLDASIPIFGLQAHGLANPKHEPFRRVEDMAAHYINEIRAIQPNGPYHLCAFSAGGLIIFEMARQLQAQGEEIAFLGMLDAYGPGYPQHLPSKSQAGYKISVHLNTLRLYGVSGQTGYLLGRVRHRLAAILTTLFANLLTKFNLAVPRKIRYEFIARLIDRAAGMYPPDKSYEGEVTIFRALTQPEDVRVDPTLGWGERVMGDIRIVDVVGTHHSIMMHEPHVAELVLKIGDQLSELHSNLSPGT